MTMLKRFGLILVLTVFSGTAIAQKAPGLLNSKVRYGKLDNGFTYYILHNEEPKERASFYIVQNVGAILEDDDQDGLAHMLEHMAFNGSTNFPGKGVKNFLESNGVEFGKNINAYTNVDETVYNISNVPSLDPVVMDSCVWILHDWSGSISLEGTEIDLERGVIKEEWRTRNNASRRIYNQLAPVNFYKSKYIERDVIGDMDVVENSDYKAIRDFYHKWYRPDLQAAVIVGDFDVDAMEARVKRILSKVPKPMNPAERIEYKIEDNKGMLFGVATDKEARTTSFNYFFKHPATPRKDKNEAYLKEQIKAGMISSMMSSRFQEILKKPDAPFVYGYIGYYNRVRTQDNFAMGGGAKENEVLKAFEAVYTEVERAKRFGFVPSELERVKTNNLKSYENQYKRRDKISNDRYASQLKDHYMVNDPQPGIEFMYEFTKKYIPTITTNDLKGYLDKWITKDNSVFTISGPDKEGVSYPTKEQIEKVIAKVKKATITPYVDEAANLTLMEKEPTPGKVSSTSTVEGLADAKVYELSNGSKVVLYPTDNVKSEIVFRAVSLGGESLLPTEQLPTALHFSSLVNRSGIGQLNETQLKKVLTGKSVGVYLSLGDYTENMSGSADKDDVETLMQLIYLSFTAPRFDQEAFDVYKEGLKPYYQNQDKDPGNIFRDTLNTVLTNGSERRPLNNIKVLDKMSFDDFKSMYADRFSNPGDFTFIFVGDFTTEELLPLVDKYIGGISGKTEHENWKDDGVSPPDQNIEKHFKFPMEVDKNTNYFRYYSDDYEYTAYNNLCLDIAASLLKKRYFETMREEEGGTYGAGVGSLTSYIPKPAMGINISFDSNPEKGEKLIEIAKREVENLINNGARSEDFDNVKESLLKGREQNLKSNWYAVGQLNEYYLTGINNLVDGNFEKILNTLTLEDFNKAIKELAGNGKLRRYEIVMKAE